MFLCGLKVAVLCAQACIFTCLLLFSRNWVNVLIINPQNVIHKIDSRQLDKAPDERISVVHGPR